MHRKVKTLGLSVASITAVVLSIAAPMGAVQAATTWNRGDVFAGVENGSYNVYDNSGAFKQTISDGRGGFTTGCAFNNDGSRLYTTNFSLNVVEAYDNNDPHAILQTIPGPSGSAQNESVVFAADGSFYVGHAGGNHVLTHYDAAGHFLANFSPAVEARGTDWVDLSNDQHTMFYTSEGTHVKRFDVAANLQLPDFASGLDSVAYALRLLPPGDGSGGLLVADTATIKRLDGTGHIVQTYDAPGENQWFALNLDPNGTSFWSGSFDTGNFYRFNIASGAKEVGPIPTRGPNTLFGLCLKGELTAAVSNITLTPPTATNPTGTNHTVTATVTTNGQPAPGVAVTFSITGGPDTGAPGTCNNPGCVTDANGQVTFTYTNNGSPGTDVIQACFIDANGVKQCATATKTWIVVERQISASGNDFSATEGQPFAAQKVASFCDPDPLSTAAEYSATIDWGDGSSSPPPPVNIVPTGLCANGAGNSFDVRGDHTYTEEATYTVTTTITDIDMASNSATVTSTATVGDAAIHAACAADPVSTQNFNGNTATFNDDNSFATSADFSATINWGDGHTSSGLISGGPGSGPYFVNGSHTYATTGAFTITTTVKDDGGATDVATCKVFVGAFPTANGGTFVVGDLEATGPGAGLTWWSSQWAIINQMSGGPAPSSMKGFAGFEDMGLPPGIPLQKICGMTWTTDTGNSTPPPQTVPDDMFVFVSSHITQNGSTISGDIKEVILVHNNPGYGPDPGHPGTGTEVILVCKVP